jgi:hypothetical protein
MEMQTTTKKTISESQVEDLVSYTLRHYGGGYWGAIGYPSRRPRCTEVIWAARLLSQYAHRIDHQIFAIKIAKDFGGGVRTRDGAGFDPLETRARAL